MAKRKLFDIKVEHGEVLLKVSPGLKGNLTALDSIQNELFELDVDYLPERLLEIYQEGANQFCSLCDVVRSDYEIFVETGPEGDAAYVSVIPPTALIEPITFQRVAYALEYAGVSRGIDEQAIQHLVTNHVENEPVLIASHQPPIDGSDGYAELAFEHSADQLDLNAHHVDVRDTFLLDTVCQGDVLVEITPPEPGTDGFRVTGETLYSRQGKHARLQSGDNTHYSDDRTQIIASKDGYVLVSENMISVENLYRVKNVDSSTGNIDFDGILIVQGNVEDSYRVEATKRIEVYGSVGKSTLISAGSIRVTQGILGGTLQAGRGVRAGFVSDSKISAGSDVVVKEYLLNSDVTARDIVYVTGYSGFIAGGRIQAGHFVRSACLGSEKTGVLTHVEVGIGLEERQQFRKLAQDLSQNFESFEKLKKNILILQMAREKRHTLPKEHESLFNNMLVAIRGFQESLREGIQEWNSLQKQISRDISPNGRMVFVEGPVYPGTVIKIRKISKSIQSKITHVAFTLITDKIQLQAFKRAITSHRKHFTKFRSAKRPDNEESS